MELNLHAWGDVTAPPVVFLHGLNAHGRRFRRLAEERLADRFHVLAPDLRGHAGSDWEPPWTIATHAHDVLETLDADGVRSATWVGHSYGGRLLLELAALVPERVERAALLDPAIQLLPHVGYDFAELERADQSFASAEEAITTRLDTGAADAARVPRGGDARASRAPPRRALSDALLPERSRHDVRGALHSRRRRPRRLRVPTLLLHAGEFGLVREEQVDAYRLALGDLVEIVEVPGGHMVYWDAYDETADALERFLDAG